jgi:hypothetical protein
MYMQNFGGQGSQCDEGQVWALMNSVKAYADTTPWFEMHCWFGEFI